VSALGRERMSDAEWFRVYGPSLGAAAASVDPTFTTEFAKLVSPLEVRARKPLGEPGRRKCFAAFFESREGFARLVVEAEKRGKTNPIGLLIRMVEASEHRLPESGEAL
jgi:hypothetical protein